MSKVWFFFACATAAVLVGCGPHWVIIKQASPNPMTLSARFFVDRVNLEGLRVGEKTEAEWMSDKSADTQQSWAGDKTAMAEEFAQGFEQGRDAVIRAGSPEGAFAIKAHFVHYEPGFYAAVMNSPAQIEAVIDIVDASGNVIDQFEIRAASDGLSAGERARLCAHQLGWVAARYVRERVGL